DAIAKRPKGAWHAGSSVAFNLPTAPTSGLRHALIDLGRRCTGSVGHFHAEHGVHEHRRVKAETGSDCAKETGDPEIEPIDCDEPAGRARDHAHRVGIHRRDGAAETEGDIEKSK